MIFLNIAKQYRLQKELVKLIFLIGRWHAIVTPPQISVARLAIEPPNDILARSHRNRLSLVGLLHISGRVEK